MRIALIVPGGVGRNGIERVIPALLSLIGRLAEDHEVVAIAMDQSEYPDCYRLCGAWIVCPGRSGGTFARLARVLAVCADFRPQVVQSFWMGATSTYAALVAGALHVPLAVHLGGGELVDLAAIGYGGRRALRSRLHVQVAIRSAAVVSAGSRYALEPLRHSRPDARWLPLGVEVSGWMPRLPAYPPRLLQVASVNWVKGPEVMLAALQVVRSIYTPAPELEWVGEDTLDGMIQAQAVDMGLAARFPGWRAHHDLPAHYAAATLYVQSSHHESQGVAVIEAAAAGLPLVGTAVGLLAELAPEAACATPAGDADALGQAIAALLADPQRCRRQAAVAREWAATYDANWTAAQFEQIYAELVEGV